MYMKARTVVKYCRSADQQVFSAALDLEQQEEWKEAEERLKSWPRSRLEAQGVALFDLTASE